MKFIGFVMVWRVVVVELVAAVLIVAGVWGMFGWAPASLAAGVLLALKAFEWDLVDGAGGDLG